MSVGTWISLGLIVKISDGVNQWRRLTGLSRKPSTQTYNQEIRDTIFQKWPDTQQAAETVTEAQLEAFVLSVAHYSDPRFNAVIQCLKSFVPVAKNLRSRQVIPKERQNLTPAKFSELLSQLDARPRSHSGLIARFLSMTGLRIGSARKLRWEHVWSDYILVPGDIMKNGKPCMIPFVNGTAEILKQLRAITGDTEFILPQASIKTALYTACDKVGIPRLSHHDFRHLYATRCIESGVDLPTASRWLGHQDGGALLGKRYFHLRDAHSRKMAAIVRI